MLDLSQLIISQAVFDGRVLAYNPWTGAVIKAAGHGELAGVGKLGVSGKRSATSALAIPTCSNSWKNIKNHMRIGIMPGLRISRGERARNFERILPLPLARQLSRMFEPMGPDMCKSFWSLHPLLRPAPIRANRSLRENPC